MNELIDEIMQRLSDEDIHPSTGEYAPNLAQVSHVLEVLTDLLEVGKIKVGQLTELSDHIRERYIDQDMRNLSITQHYDWGVKYT